MGFEVKFKCYKRNPETGNYDEEDVGEYTKKVGKQTEDVPLEKLAFVILNQMSRRDIFVKDVEIYEYVKRKLTFKESKSGDGIIIGGKKFGSNSSYDTELDIVVEEPEVSHPQQIAQQSSPEDMMKLMQQQMLQMQQQLQSMQQPQQTPAMHSSSSGIDLRYAEQKALGQQLQNKNVDNNRPVRYEFFKPDPDLVPLIKEKGLRFTIENKYPVYGEKLGSNGIVYVTEDDDGKRMMLHSMYFVPNIGVVEPPSTRGTLQIDTLEDKSKLSYGEQDHGMPDLRPRMRY